MRRSELRRAMREARRSLRERLESTPAFKAAREARARRRRRVLAAIAIALLLLLLLRCEGPPGPPAERAPASPVVSPKPSPSPKPTARGSLDARLEPQNRPGYTLDARPGPDWLDDFRLQVAARSPRLAECFNGSERGGTLRWTVSIDAKTGTVADHDFEPLGSGASLRSDQKACATRALSQPGYLLKNSPADALPNRVSLVLEF